MEFGKVNHFLLDTLSSLSPGNQAPASLAYNFQPLSLASLLFYPLDSSVPESADS